MGYRGIERARGATCVSARAVYQHGADELEGEMLRSGPWCRRFIMCARNSSTRFPQVSFSTSSLRKTKFSNQRADRKLKVLRILRAHVDSEVCIARNDLSHGGSRLEVLAPPSRFPICFSKLSLLLRFAKRSDSRTRGGRHVRTRAGKRKRMRHFL